MKRRPWTNRVLSPSKRRSLLQRRNYHNHRSINGVTDDVCCPFPNRVRVPSIFHHRRLFVFVSPVFPGRMSGTKFASWADCVHNDDGDDDVDVALNVPFIQGNWKGSIVAALRLYLPSSLFVSENNENAYLF